MNSCVLFLLAALLPAAVHGVSSGFVDTCNALDPGFGCANFSMGDRLRCMERPARLMGWVLKPVFDATKFEVFAGEEAAKVTTYTPGKWMRISLRTKTFDNQYRGILLYAVDLADTSADPQRVGSFQFTDTRPLFHSWCPGAVLHASADPMPFLTSWRYLPPANFTGTLKFISLIKVGPANQGEFYYGNQLQLTRVGAAPTPEMKWYLGASNKSCDETCVAAGANLMCDAAKLATVNSATALDRLVAPFVTCKLPYLVRCGDQGVAMDPTGLCYYPNAAQCMTAGLGTTTVMPTCEAKSDDRNVGRRICPCAINPAVVTTTSTTRAPVTTTTTTRPVGTTTRPVVTTTSTRTVITTTTRVVPTTTVSGTTRPVSPTSAPTTRPPTATTTTNRPSATTTGVPLCTGKFGCQCGADGACESGTVCTLNGNQGFCMRGMPLCAAGDLGCACKAGAACNDALVCKETGVCVRNEEDKCRVGQLGCECLEDATCTQANNKCVRVSNDGTDKGVCALTDASCDAGARGCLCDKGSCTNAGDSCQIVGNSEVCLSNEIIVPGPIIAAAAPLAASYASVCLVALLAVLLN